MAQATSSTAANQSGAARATQRNKTPPVSAPTSIARTEISRRPRADLGRGVGDQTGDGQDEHRRGQVGYGQPAYDGVWAAPSRLRAAVGEVGEPTQRLAVGYVDAGHSYPAEELAASGASVTFRRSIPTSHWPLR